MCLSILHSSRLPYAHLTRREIPPSPFSFFFSYILRGSTFTPCWPYRLSHVSIGQPEKTAASPLGSDSFKPSISLAFLHFPLMPWPFVRFTPVCLLTQTHPSSIGNVGQSRSLGFSMLPPFPQPEERLIFPLPNSTVLLFSRFQRSKDFLVSQSIPPLGGFHSSPNHRLSFRIPLFRVSTLIPMSSFLPL